MTPDMTGRENLDREHLEESISEMFRREGISDRYGGSLPRGTVIRDFGSSDRMAGSHDDEYSLHASATSRGYEGHRAARGYDYDSDASISPVSSVSSDVDDSDDDTLTRRSVGPRSGGIRGHRRTVREELASFAENSFAAEPTRPRYGGTRGHRRTVSEELASFAENSFAAEPTRPRYGGTRGPRFEGTRGHHDIVREDYNPFDGDSFPVHSARPRYGGTRGPRFEGARGCLGLDRSYSRGTGPRCTNEGFEGSMNDSAEDTTNDSTDDEFDYPTRGGRRGHDSHPANYGAQSRRQEFLPSSRRY